MKGITSEELKTGVETGRASLSEGEEFVRFSLTFRIQHMVLAVSCFLLIITGLPLRFSDTSWAQAFFTITGGLSGSGLIHRIGAVGLIGMGIFHLFYISCLAEGRQLFKALLPKIKDVQDVYGNVLHFFGLSERRAMFGRFSYIEKFDYWAVYWGMVIMITTGMVLWQYELVMAYMPKLFIDIAREVHSDEALLATLAIVVWHMYNAHFNPDHFPMNRVWLTGKLTAKQMKHHHPLLYEEIMARRAKLDQAEDSDVHHGQLLSSSDEDS